MHAHDALPLLVIALGAFLIPLLSGRIGIPSAVGEILYGIVVGPYALGLIHRSAFTTFLAEFGFAFLMFLVGLELDFSRIERGGIRGVLFAAAVSALFFVAAGGMTVALGLTPYLFLAFGAVSVGILMVTLNEVGLARSSAGQEMIFVGSLAEFLTIVLVTAVGLYYRIGLGWSLAVELSKLAAILGAAYLVLVVLRTWIWWRPRMFARVVAARDPSEIGVRAGMAMMLVFVALAAMMGVEAILGAFVAGALFSFVFREKGILETKMSSIGFGFFVPIFFISVGADFDLAAVLSWEVLSMVALFFGISLVAKGIAALPLRLRGMTWRETAGAALLFGAPLTLLVVIARLGEEVEVLDATTSAALILLAILTSIVLPWAFRGLTRGAPPVD